MHCIKRLLAAILIISFSAAPLAAKVYIDISAPSATRVPIIIPPFQNSGSDPDTHRLATRMSKVITDNLDFSGLFQIIDPALLGEARMQGITRSEIEWDSLATVGAEAIITGSFAVSRNRLSAELRLFDAVQGRFIIGKKYRGTPDDYRRICHRFSNKVVRELTGAPGIFETGIVFARETREIRELYYIDYDGSNQRRLTSLNSLTLSPCFSPDGSMLAFTSYRDGNPDAYIMNLEGGNIEKISGKSGVNIAPDWSPDGRKIALTLSLTDGNSEIYTLDIRRRTFERVTNHWALDVSPSWSPDGTRIAFVSSRSGGPQIFIQTLADNTVRRVTFGKGNYNTTPAWSPRGDLIAYTGLNDGYFNIHCISPDGSFHRQLTSGQGNNETPSWSPDGRYIAFSSNRTGRKEIYIMRADGTGQRQITFGSGDKTDPAWSPFPKN